MQHRPGTHFIGTVPAGSKIVRTATIDDLLIDPSRVVLVETPDGQQMWIPDDKTGLTSSSQTTK